MTSSEDAAMPPDVLAVFLEIKRRVDESIDALTPSGTGMTHDRAVCDDARMTDATTITVYPDGIQSDSCIGAPTITVADVRQARAWLAKATLPAAYVAGKYGDALADRAADGTLDRLGDLLDVAERWLS